MQEDQYDPPRETSGDNAHAAGRSLVGAVPFAGQTALEMLNKIIRPPIERRLEEWRCSIAEGLRELEEKQQCVVDSLKENDAYLDTFLQASQAAIRTSQQEKLQALRNVVLNSALPSAPDEPRRAMFVQLIDVLSSLHLRVLYLLDDPEKWFTAHNQEITQRLAKTLWPMVLAAFPDVAQEEMLCERICKELNEKGLLIATSLRKDVNRYPFMPDLPRERQTGYKFADELPSDGGVSYSGNPTSIRNWTTELGRQFLDFISVPPDAN